MKADEKSKNPMVATDPVTGSAVVPPPTHNKPDGDAVVGGEIADFFGDAKIWAGRNARWIGLGLAVVLVIGIWSFWSGQSRQGTSRLWAGLEETRDPAALKTFADQNSDTVPGRIARMEFARTQLGTDGIAKLNSREPGERDKGIENIERARAEFLAIAQEFPDDITMQAEALKSAAAAELTLVAIPKADATPGDPNSYRGSVGEAAMIYEKLATVVGKETSIGKWAETRASKLKSGEADVVSVSTTLNQLMTPRQPSGIKPPSTDLGKPPPTGTGPKAPDKPIATPVPPPLPKKPPGTKRIPPPATKR